MIMQFEHELQDKHLLGLLNWRKDEICVLQ
jgi:hypothetical protein